MREGFYCHVENGGYIVELNPNSCVEGDGGIFHAPAIEFEYTYCGNSIGKVAINLPSIEFIDSLIKLLEVSKKYQENSVLGYDIEAPEEL